MATSSTTKTPHGEFFALERKFLFFLHRHETFSPSIHSRSFCTDQNTVENKLAGSEFTQAVALIGINHTCLTNLADVHRQPYIVWLTLLPKVVSRPTCPFSIWGFDSFPKGTSFPPLPVASPSSVSTSVYFPSAYSAGCIGARLSGKCSSFWCDAPK